LRGIFFKKNLFKLSAKRALEKRKNKKDEGIEVYMFLSVCQNNICSIDNNKKD